MKICPKCKKQYEDNQKFCKICGVPLVEAKKEQGFIYMSPNDETKCIRYIGPEGAVQDFEIPVVSTGLGNGIGEFCEAGYMEPYWLGKK